MKNRVLLIYLLLFVILVGCIKETNSEEEKPIMELLSPLPCDTLQFGKAFLYKVKITDNNGLGAISMDVHHNFGHHNHGAHESCDMDEVKEALNPFSDNWIFSLPAKETEFVFDTLLKIPSKKNDSAFFDEGDYHFHIYLTDNEGYQTFTTMDVKIVY